MTKGMIEADALLTGVYEEGYKEATKKKAKQVARLKERKCEARAIDHLPTVKVPCNECQECNTIREAFPDVIEVKDETVYCGCGNTITDENIEVCRECK